jgi:signal transduction histidine kinase
MKSLEKQLQISLAIVMIIILFGLLIIANVSTRNLLQNFVSSRLEHDAKHLLETLKIDSNPARIRWRRINPIYNKPNSGHYYVISIKDGQGKETLLRSPSLQQRNLPTITQKQLFEIIHDVSGPQNQRLIVWSKQYDKKGQQVTISVAEDMRVLMEKRHHFRLLFLVLAGVGFLLILVLQRFVIHRLFKHLDQTRQEIKKIESGNCQQLSEQVPTEIYPLVKEFNHSLSLMQQRLERSRNALGNLAHALKTPLSILMQQLDNKDTTLNKVHQQRLEQAKKQAERIHQLMERELKRARMAGLGNTVQRFNPHEDLVILTKVLKRSHSKQGLQITLLIAPEVTHFGDREDMLELLGNLLDNACKWASSHVICTLSGEKSIKIMIEDDGLGRSDKEIINLTQRGVRVDESIQGHGLGLAICKDIVKLYGGSIHFGKSKVLGGFLVDVLLPNK